MRTTDFIRLLSIQFIMLSTFSLLLCRHLYSEEGTLSTSSALKLFPEASSESIVTLNPGAKVNIIQKNNDWCLIHSDQHGNKIKGWLPCAHLQTAVNAHEKETSTSRGIYPREEPRFSLAINPVTLLFPWIELQIGIPISPRVRFNITPQLLTWAWGNDPFEGSIYGGTLSASFFFDDWSGWYMEPGMLFLRPSSGGGYWLGGQLIGGYEHTWSSGFFVNIGIGAGIGQFDDGEDDNGFLDFSGTYPYPTGNLHIGVKF